MISLYSSASVDLNSRCDKMVYRWKPSLEPVERSATSLKPSFEYVGTISRLFALADQGRCRNKDVMF